MGLAGECCEWVQLNYENLENRRIKPAVIRIPEEIRLKWWFDDFRALIILNRIRRYRVRSPRKPRHT